MMEIPTADTHVAVDVTVLDELLTERLFNRGLSPCAPALDAEGGALLVWHDAANDELAACKVASNEDDDPGGVTMTDPDRLAYPVLVFMLRQGHGIPEGTEVSFNG